MTVTHAAADEAKRFGDRDAPYRTRLSVLFAAKGRRAVILRRGPRLHNQLLTWDLASDTFTPGQWMKGTVHLWDLDPAGQKLIYWARQWHRSAPKHPESEDDGSEWVPEEQPVKLRRRTGRRVPRYMRALETSTVKRMGLRPRRNEGVWTAISRPPFFTALAIWPSFGHWTGGGAFDDGATIRLQESDDGLVPKVNVPLPQGFSIHSALEDSINPQLDFCASHGHSPFRLDRYAQVEAALTDAGARWLEFFFEDRRDLLFGADGRIFRLRDWLRVEEAEIADAAVCLADLRTNRFELIAPPPDALTWGWLAPMSRPPKAVPRRKPR